jgi:hypothetical protein
MTPHLRPDRVSGRSMNIGDVVAAQAAQSEAYRRERRIERLIDRLPARLQGAVCWLRRPSSRWARIPAGILLIAGGLLSILPLLGIWMLPVGLILLSEDVPLLERARERILDWIDRHRPQWVQ